MLPPQYYLTAHPRRMLVAFEESNFLFYADSAQFDRINAKQIDYLTFNALDALNDVAATEVPPAFSGALPTVRVSGKALMQMVIHTARKSGRNAASNQDVEPLFDAGSRQAIEDYFAHIATNIAIMNGRIEVIGAETSMRNADRSFVEYAINEELAMRPEFWR